MANDLQGAISNPADAQQKLTQSASRFEELAGRTGDPEIQKQTKVVSDFYRQAAQSVKAGKVPATEDLTKVLTAGQAIGQRCSTRK